VDETFERLRREWIGSEASHIASPSEQLDEACSEAVIKGYHQGSVIRRACSRGPRDLRRVYGIGSMLTGPEGRRRAIVRAASGGSNPVSSSGESNANLTSSIKAPNNSSGLGKAMPS
jgi:hypothetical protein